MSISQLVVANWKMHGRLASNRALVDALLAAGPFSGATCVLCVPAPYLLQVGELLEGSDIILGAQNVAAYRDDGAYTGEISAAMLRDVGCRFVIVGHSERRALYCEGDALVVRKLAAAQAEGLTPILCIGETLAERDAGQVETVLARQLDAALDAEGVDVGDLVVAYEPVWAIGTGRSATPEQVAAVHAFLRARLQARGARTQAVPLLYGGSVKPDTAASLFAIDQVNGALVGGASLVAEDFSAICNQASR